MSRIRELLCLITAGLWLGAAQAATPVPTQAVATPALQDAASRMTIPVLVNGQGPFPFVIDTGADRTVISAALAARLGLPPGRDVRLHDTAGAAQVRTAVLGTLSFGGRDVENVQAAVLDEQTLGAQGMLGIDSLRDQRVIMDFKAGTFAAAPSRIDSAREPAGTIVVYGQRRFGQLVLVDAEANGAPIFVILDSGAQNSLGNSALQHMLSTMGRPKVQMADVISVMGGHTPADLRHIGEIRLGGITLRDVPIAYADLETFRQFGLSDRPAMLLGMDILHLFRSVSVDFMRREAAFRTQ